MKTQKIKGLDIIPPKSHSGEYETPDDMPRSHMITIAVAKRNGGKTTAITNMIEKMKYDYCIVVSPTMQSNKELMSRLNVKHTFEDPDCPKLVDKIKEIIENEAKDLERYRDEMRRYNKMMKAMNSDDGHLEDNDLILFFGDNKDFMKPKHEYNGRPPMIIVLFDDCLGSMLYSKPRKLNALSTYSRHIGQLKEGGAVGVSLAFLIQSYKCQTGGLNKVIRNQCTNLLVFKTKDQNEMKDIYESVAGEIDEETFYNVYNKAIGNGENYPFLFIDFHKKPHQPSMFRSKFNEYIITEKNKK